jgi:hypothetical protein
MPFDGFGDDLHPDIMSEYHDRAQNDGHCPSLSAHKGLILTVSMELSKGRAYIARVRWRPDVQ